MERIISIFHKEDDKLFAEVSVNFLQIEILREIFRPRIDDPSMHMVYHIHDSEAVQLKKYVNIDFDFAKYTYQLDCFE